MKILLKAKNKTFFATGKDDCIMMEFTDKEAVYDNETRAEFSKKGEMKAKFSQHIFEYLEGYNVHTHYINNDGAAGLQVKKLNMLPISVMVRNVVAGSLSERFKVEEGRRLKYPVLEFYLLDDNLGRPLIHESHAYALNYATPDDLKHISRLASKANAVLKSFFERRYLKLVDYKLEFGKFQNQVFIADEITPDTCRLWDIKGDELQKMSFTGKSAEKSYQTICSRVY